MEILLHQHLGKHRNVIEFLGSGENPAYQWIAMELADGGDLFDKIEADIGVGEDIAHFYFTQLMSAISYMHSKGVAHRDIKPENMLLSKDGDLKVADFGLAALFRKGDEIRLCNTVCGSPPYIAPEVVAGKRVKRADILESGYAPNVADIWSCGIVLFVLLVGNTPWDEPTMKSYEFKEYVETNGRTSDELWHKLTPGVQSLLRGMLKLDPKERFTLEEVRRHPWFTQANPYLSSTGTARDPIALATKLIESLHIDVDAEPTLAQPTHQPDIDCMEIDPDARMAFTQPETPLADTPFEWERPPRFSLGDGISASQPVWSHANTQVSQSLLDHLADDPSMSQFSQTPSVPLSLTQAAKRFGDIVPAHSLARFLSAHPLSLLLPLIVEALHRLGIPTTPVERTDQAYVKVKTIDGRQQGLVGTVIIERWNEDVCEVRFVKAKGDPIEWRRFFKRIVAICKDAVLVP
jgi:serine/threonine-protein kinase Chk1